MRKAFIETLYHLAQSDERILLLTGDLGYMVMEPFRERFPERFFNVGVAEQNMIAVATGLAECGFFPYVYSIATFAALRPFEFIRNGPVLHQLPVRIVGMGMGFEYAHAGPTHYGVEDVAVMRALPGLTVVIPADSAQAAEALRRTAAHPGPVYYSLGKNDEASVPGLNGRFELGRVQVLRRGQDVAIVTMGSIALEAARAGDVLARECGIHATVAVVSNFDPDPGSELLELLHSVPAVLVVEAQVSSGGLAGFVGSIIASHGLRCLMVPLGVRTPPDGTSGSQNDRWRKHGIDMEAIVKAATGRRTAARV